MLTERSNRVMTVHQKIVRHLLGHVLAGEQLRQLPKAVAAVADHESAVFTGPFPHGR